MDSSTGNKPTPLRGRRLICHKLDSLILIIVLRCDNPRPRAGEFFKNLYVCLSIESARDTYTTV